MLFQYTVEKKAIETYVAKESERDIQIAYMYIKSIRFLAYYLIVKQHKCVPALQSAKIFDIKEDLIYLQTVLCF